MGFSPTAKEVVRNFPFIHLIQGIPLLEWLGHPVQTHFKGTFCLRAILTRVCGVEDF